ncbi:MAG: trehalose-phosphatase [Myxococcota bacterium]
MADPGDRSIAERVAALGRPLLVALDVDGTLAPIVDDPEAARVPETTRSLLEQLEAAGGVHVALVTGRDAASLESLAGPLRVWRAVSHGRVVLSPGEPAKPAELSSEARTRLDAMREWAQRVAVPGGARVEEKDGAVAVHVRELAQRDPAAAEALLEQARAEAERRGLHARLGRAVCEAEVEPGDKATALQKLLDATGAAGVAYAGDDLTDFPAIRLATRRGGIGIFIASGERQPPAEATDTLPGPERIPPLLEALLQALR